MPCLLGSLAFSSRAQQSAAPAGPPSAYAIEAPVPLQGNGFTLSNPLGIAFAEQPVQVLLTQPAPEGTSLVVDEAGKTVGQVQSDRGLLSLRSGFAQGQTERRFSLARGAAATGLEHPVSLRTVAWTQAQTKAVGTTHSNGIASYYEISNGLCGVRVPASMRPDALPGLAVPAPIVGVQHKDGEWAGRPDFRAFVVPATGSDHGNIPRAEWRFTGFTSQIVEQGPVRTTVQLAITKSNRAEPYGFEITLYAGERLVKFRQLSGRLNDWFLDLSLDKKTPWRPTRWRTGGTHHFAKDTVELPDRAGQKFMLGFDKGPGPTTQHDEYVGEGEGDLFSHKDLWVEFDWDWGQARLLNKAGDGDASHSKFAASVRGLPLWWPWAGVGNIVYALDPKGGATAPVAGLLNGPAGEVEGWEARDDPRGEAGFCQHIPAQLDLDPAVYDSAITHKYLLNGRYQGISAPDRATPIFGVRFTMNTRGGSFFLWLGDNSDILPDISDPKFTIGYRSPLWQDYSRFTSGVANLQDALAWNLTWDDPAGGSLYSIEPEVIKANIERARKGENLGGSQLVNLWKLSTDAERVAAADEFIKNLREHPDSSIRRLMQRAQAEHWEKDGVFQWYTYDRTVAGRLNDLKTYLSLGRKAQGGLLSDEQWGWLKYFAAFYFQTEFDEDRALFWNAGTDMNHGGGSMTSQGNLARLGIILDFPTWPDAKRYAALPIAEQEKALQNEFGRWGAQFTGTHYSSLAAITQPLAGLLNFQWRSRTQPEKFPDKFAMDPRLRHYAFFVLNRTGVRDPRYGNVRVPIAVGNGGAGWGHPAAALLSSGFRHLDPQLSRWMMWDWVANGKSTNMTPLLPTMFDYGTSAEPYPFPAISTFPGNMTIHRSAPHTPHETGVWITDGNFFFQHREPAEAGEVHIDALGKPLVTNSTSYVFPQQGNELYKNVIGTSTTGWDRDSFYRGDWRSPWQDDRVKAIAEFPDGSYSRSEFTSADTDKKGLTWQRHIILARPDPENPVIAIRDVLSRPGEYTSTFWMQTEGAVTAPGGQKITPPLKMGPTNNVKEPTPEQSPSAVKVAGLAAGASTFGFSGHDWLKLYPKSYAKAGVADVGPLVDVDVHIVNAAQAQAVVGHWRVFDHGNRFTNDADGSFDDRQYLRVKFSGSEHITVFTPFHRGKRPADLKVAREANGAVRVSYTNARKARRAIIITPTGYRVETNGKATGRAVFADKMPGKLYPQWKDVDYPGPAKP